MAHTKSEEIDLVKEVIENMIIINCDDNLNLLDGDQAQVGDGEEQVQG